MENNIEKTDNQQKNSGVNTAVNRSRTENGTGGFRPREPRTGGQNSFGNRPFPSSERGQYPRSNYGEGNRGGFRPNNSQSSNLQKTDGTGTTNSTQTSQTEGGDNSSKTGEGRRFGDKGSSQFGSKQGDRNRGDKRHGSRRPVNKSPVSNLFSKVLSIDRVGKTNAGGKVISFSAFSVVGDENGSVGVGLGKSKEVSTAVEKSKNMAMKNMFKINSANNLDSIPHNVQTKFRGTRLFLRKGKKGHIASNLAKNIFKAAGLKNMVSKALGARSVKNTAYAIIESLKKVESIEMIAERRSMTVKELLNRKKNVILYGLMRQDATKRAGQTIALNKTKAVLNK